VKSVTFERSFAPDPTAVTRALLYVLAYTPKSGEAQERKEGEHASS
jgi:hypothetical protein